jgi:hypothetical protein
MPLGSVRAGSSGGRFSISGEGTPGTPTVGARGSLGSLGSSSLWDLWEKVLKSKLQAADLSSRLERKRILAQPEYAKARAAHRAGV